jgi:OmpA-OmpF porin, OOP family
MKGIVLSCLIVLGVANMSKGQIENTKEKAKVKTETRVNQRTDEAIDSGLDRIEDGIRNAFKKKNKRKDKKQKRNSSTSDKNQQNSSPTSQSTGSSSSTVSGNGANSSVTNSHGSSNHTDFTAYKNFDFVPGEHTLFFDDFTKQFEQWNRVTWDEWEEHHRGVVSPSAVAEGNWFYMPRKGMYAPKNIKALPNQFTIEFDFYYDEEHTEHEGGINVMLVKESGFDINNYDFYFERNTRVVIDLHPAGKNLFLKGWREYGYTNGIDNGDRIIYEQKENYLKPNQVNRVSITRNGSQVIVYVNQDKLIDLPNGLPSNEKYTFMFGNNSWHSGLYINNVRIASGIPEPMIMLGEKQTFSTPNIRFNVNSDRIKPESFSVLKEIANAIKANNNYTYLIVGHTDSDGLPENNLVLSERRAEAVKQVLIKEFGVPANQLTIEGKGGAEPLNENRNASEKAQNRRVEFKPL